jgi:hypothetical protein
MARYTCSYLVGLSEKEMLASLKDILEACDLTLTYEKSQAKSPFLNS